MNTLKALLILSFTFICGSLWAQEINFTAASDRNPVSVGENFQVSFTLNTSGKNFKAPSFSDFNVLSGPNQSTSMQIINGAMSQTVTLSFILQPKKEGTYKIGPAVVEVLKGQQIQSNSLTIKVEKGSAQSSRAGQGAAQQGGASNANVDKQIAQNLFIRVSVNKSNITVGEEIIATYKLYSRVNLVNFGASKAPALTGFYSQDIQIPQRLELHKEMLDGVQYNVGELKKVVLSPQYSGTLELDSYEGDCVVRLQTKRKSSGDDFFDQFFNDPFFGNGAQDVNYKAKSAPLKITVKPLPSTQPADFCGGVGKFSIQTKLDKETVKANDPVSLKITISGSGNLKLINPPKLNFPPDFEAYDPKSTDNVTVSLNGSNGSRTFEYLIIPRHAGTYKVDPTSFSYFDLDKKQYVKLSTPQFSIKVEPGAAGSESSAPIVSSGGVTQEDVAVLGKDIRFIKTGKTTLSANSTSFYGSGLFYSLYALPLLLFLGFIAFYSKNKALNSNVKLAKSRKANKVAFKRLQDADKFLKENSKDKFYDEIYKALWGYVSDKLGIGTAHLTKESAYNHLRQRGASTEIADKFTSVLNNCEFARFAPGGTAEMQHVYDITVDVISNIEQSIK